MQQLFHNWVFFVSGYLIFAVLFSQFYKLAVKNSQNESASTVLLQLIAGLSVLIYSFFFKFTFSKDIKVYLLLALACIFYAINDRLQTTVRKRLDVSVFTIINELSTIFLIAFGILIFKEPLVLLKIIGALLIFLANVILVIDRNSYKFDIYWVLGILSRLFFSIAIFIDVGINQQFNLPIYISITLILPAFFISITQKVNLNDIKKEFVSGAKRYYLATGFAWGGLILFRLRAYAFGKVSIVSPVSSSVVLLNAIVAYFFLKEKKQILRKIIAALLVIIGVYLTVYY